MQDDLVTMICNVKVLQLKDLYVTQHTAHVFSLSLMNYLLGNLVGTNSRHVMINCDGIVAFSNKDVTMGN